MATTTNKTTTPTTTTVRKLGCMVPCKPGTCLATAQAKAAAWGGSVHAELGTGGPTRTFKNPRTGKQQLVGDESRMYIISVPDDRIVAVYAEPFASSPGGKLLVALSKARKPDDALAAMRTFNAGHTMTELTIDTLFSAGQTKSPRWGAFRHIGTVAAWLIGETGGVLLLPMVPTIAALYGAASVGRRSNNIVTDATELAAIMVDCE